MNTSKSNWLSPFWLSHGFLVIAAALVWNALSLGYTLYVHAYMRRWDWWWLLALLFFLFLLSLIGLLIALRNAKLNQTAIQYNQKKPWLIPLQTGLATFLIGWIPAVFIVCK